MNISTIKSYVVHNSSMSSSKRENIEQIPKDDNLGEVQKAVSEQGGVEGQRKEVNDDDDIEAAALGRLLKELDFPTDKNRIIQLVQQKVPIRTKERRSTKYSTIQSR